MLEKFKKSKFNETLHREVKFEGGKPTLGEIPDKPFFGANTPLNPKYEKADTPEVMGAEGLGFGNELLKNNKERFFNQIKKLAEQKGTWTPENIRKKEAYKKAIYNLPLIHYSTVSKFGESEFLAMDSINKSGGLKSYDKLSENKEYGLQGSNTYDFDIDLGRDRYVYFTLGSVYLLGSYNLDKMAVVLNASKLQNLNCIVQNASFTSSLALNNSNDWQNMNESSLLGQDYVEMISLAIATEVAPWKNINNSEVMFKDVVLPSDVEYVLFTDKNDDDLTTREQYLASLEELEKLSNTKNKKQDLNTFHSKAIYQTPNDLFIRMQINDIGDMLKPDFSKPGIPWYKKVYNNYLEEMAVKNKQQSK